MQLRKLEGKTQVRINDLINTLHVNGFDDPSLLLKMIEQQQQQIALLLKIAQSNDVIADKDYQPIIDESLLIKR